MHHDKVKSNALQGDNKDMFINTLSQAALLGDSAYRDEARLNEHNERALPRATWSSLIATGLAVVTIMALSWAVGNVLLGFMASFFLITTGLLTFIVIQMVRPRKAKPFERALLMTALDSNERAMAISDARGVLICANTLYGQLLCGFPSPRNFTACEKGALNGAGLADLAVHEGSAYGEIIGSAKDGRQSEIVADVRRARFGEGYLLWQLGAKKSPQDQRQTAEKNANIWANWLTDHGVGLTIVNDDGTILHANQQFATWANVSQDKLIARDLEDFCVLDIGAGTAEFHRGELADLHLICTSQPVIIEGAPVTTALFFEDPSKVDLRMHQQGDGVKSDHLPQQLFDDAPVGIAIVDETGALHRVNGPTKQILGSMKCDGSVRLMDLVVDDNRDIVANMLTKAVGGQADRKPLEVKFRNNPDNVTQIFARPLRGGSGAVFYLIDTTEQRQLELQFTQAQKLQAVGQLAGGIAHDFNNILTAMIGFCDLLLVRHSAGDASFSDIMQIKQNANRAANLVRQLLAFSRQQTLRPSILSVTDVLAELSNLLRRLIGENIELKMIHGRDLGPVKVDQGQLEQVIINLAVNARDAMTGGGELVIATSMVSARNVAKLGHSFMSAQDYVALAFKDTGHGIPKDVIEKIFEPFFTTKEVGKGTGLGLSTVYGIVKQTGGFIFAESEKDNGACFTIYLPVHVRKAEDLPEPVERRPVETVADLWGHGTILLVEDEAAVRTFAYRALTKKGYSVLEAANGEAALDVVNSYDGTIDLVISDVIMPNMDGPTLVKEITRLRPEVKIIFISGYAQDGFRNGSDTADYHFLPKPFSLSQLAEKVKTVMQED